MSVQGSVHVPRPSRKVTAPPGGFTSNIFGGGAYESDSKNERIQSENPNTIKENMNHYSTNERPLHPVPSNPDPSPLSSPPSSFSQTKAPVWCSEGSQIRQGLCRKIQQPPGGFSSISFG